MKIAVSSTGIDLNAQVDPRFGRCQYFIVVDPDTMEYEVLENSGAMSGGGAGIATSQLVVGKGVGAVLTGNCGPKAFRTLTAASVGVYLFAEGTVKDAIEAFKAGTLSSVDSPNVEGHWS